MTARRYNRPALIARIAALAVLYFVGGRLGLSLAYVNSSTSAVWPATGIAVAALILFGRERGAGPAVRQWRAGVRSHP